MVDLEMVLPGYRGKHKSDLSRTPAFNFPSDKMITIALYYALYIAPLQSLTNYMLPTVNSNL